jgi:aquaporin Z
MEGAGLGLYMIAACAFVVLLEYPTSPVHQALPDPALRRVSIGTAMGLTAIGIIYSPLGQRSGAHFNPAVTLTFFRLAKVEFWDAAFYGAAQFIGGLLGVILAHPSVRYAATVPGMAGVGVAFLAETVISFLQMSLILRFSNTNRSDFTGTLEQIAEDVTAARILGAAEILIDAQFSPGVETADDIVAQMEELWRVAKQA